MSVKTLKREFLFSVVSYDKTEKEREREYFGSNSFKCFKNWHENVAIEGKTMVRSHSQSGRNF